MSSDKSNESDLNNFIRLYKPVRYNNEPIIVPESFENAVGHYVISCVNLHNMICHFINLQRVFELFENYIESEKVKFDVVISLRVDIVFHNKLNFDNIEENTIYIPYECDCGGINDQWAYGTVSTIKKYNNLFLNMMDFLEKKIINAHPECLTLANIQFHKLNIKRVRINYYIKREH
jgi:hypothetical protein